MPKQRIYRQLTSQQRAGEAIKFDMLIRNNEIHNQSDLAELGYITRARVTQIMNMLHLAPDIQEQILYMEPILEGKDPIAERQIRPILQEIDWDRQRRMWKRLSYPILCIAM